MFHEFSSFLYTYNNLGRNIKKKTVFLTKFLGFAWLQNILSIHLKLADLFKNMLFYVYYLVF